MTARWQQPLSVSSSGNLVGHWASLLTARGAGEALVLVSLRADSTRSAVASLRVTR